MINGDRLHRQQWIGTQRIRWIRIRAYRIDNMSLPSAKRTSLESWQVWINQPGFQWTKVTGEMLWYTQFWENQMRIYLWLFSSLFEIITCNELQWLSVRVAKANHLGQKKHTLAGQVPALLIKPEHCHQQLSPCLGTCKILLRSSSILVGKQWWWGQLLPQQSKSKKRRKRNEKQLPSCDVCRDRGF